MSLINQMVIAVAITAFFGGLAKVVVGWAGQKPAVPWDWRQFIADIPAAVVAGLGIAETFNYSGTTSVLLACIVAFMAGYGAVAGWNKVLKVSHVTSAAREVKATPPPTITAVTPATGVQGANPLGVTISGTGLLTVPWSGLNFGPGVAVISTLHLSDTILLANLALAADAVVGPRDVSATSPSGTSTLPGGFAVIASSPTPTEQVLTIKLHNGASDLVIANVSATLRNVPGSKTVSVPVQPGADAQAVVEWP